MAPFRHIDSKRSSRAPAFETSDVEDDYISPAPNGKRKAGSSRRPHQPVKLPRHNKSRTTPGSPGIHRAPSDEESVEHEAPHLGGRQGLGDVAEYDGGNSAVTRFTRHRCGLTSESIRRDSGRKESVSTRPSTREKRKSGREIRARGASSTRQQSARFDSAYGSSPGITRKRPLKPTRRVPSTKPDQSTESYFTSLSNAVKSIVSSVTGRGVDAVIPEELPASNEADIQSRLQAEHRDESDSEFSEGAWGRTYFAPPPWVMRRRGEEVGEGRVEARYGAAASSFRDGRYKSSHEQVTATHGPKPVSYPARDSEVKRPKVKSVAKKVSRSVAAVAEWKRVSKAGSSAKGNTVKTGPAEYVIVPKSKVAHDEQVKRPVPPEGVKSTASSTVPKPSNAAPEQAPDEEPEEPGPPYTYGDIEVRDMMWQIQDLMEEVAGFFLQKDLPAAWARNKTKTLTRIYKEPDVSTQRVLEWVAGRRWAEDAAWHELFDNKDKRQAVVLGVLGNVLVEQVLKHPFFGGDSHIIHAIYNSTEELREEDAFSRKHASATLLREPLFLDGPDLEPPEDFPKHVDAVVTALDIHLRPLLNLVGTRPVMQSLFITHLTRLVGTAGLLSLQMAADPHAVYYFVPVSRDDVFSHEEHDALNDQEMERTHPRGPKTVFADEKEREKRVGEEAVVEVGIMDGLTVYRRGGWEDMESWVKWDGDRFVGRRYARKEYGEMGYRARVLVRGLVFCKWGRRGE